MARRKSVNNLRKRNRLIASLSAAGAGTARRAGDESFDALTDADRRAVAAARAVPAPHPVVSKRQLDVPGGWACGGIYVYPGPVVELRARFLPAEDLNFGPLFENRQFFLGKSPADVFECLLRWHRAATDEPLPTVDVATYFDGNGDRSSIAPNVIDDDRGPTFELIRDTLLAVSRRRGVAAVGVEIGELPNDNPADDDIWPAAERVFIWTTEPAKTVRGWMKALRPTAVARADRKAIAEPAGKSVPARAKVYEVVWD